MKKGSAIIVVIASMTYILMLAIPLIGLAYTGTAISRSSKNIEECYFIAEGGVERSISEIKNEFIPDFENLHFDCDSEEMIKYALDDYTKAFFSNFSHSKLKQYNNYNNDDGLHAPNGIDTASFSKLSGVPAYYVVTNVKMERTSLRQHEEGLYQYDIPLEITSKGHLKNAVEDIKALLEIEMIFKARTAGSDESAEQCIVDDGLADTKFLEFTGYDIRIIRWQS